MIELQSVYKKTGADYSLFNISFSVAQGETAAVIGRRGSGKTALADIMSGCSYASHGSVKVNGYDMSKHPLEAKRSLGYLPQRPTLYPEMTVDEYMSFVCSLRHVPGNQAKQRAADALEKAGAAAFGGQLIRGLDRMAQRRAALAGTLCGGPKALILDEPLFGLDPDEAEAFRETVKSLKDEFTIVLLTRSIREAVDICKSVIVLCKGATTACQTTESLLDSVGASCRLKVKLKAERQKGLELLRSIEGVEYAEALGSSESGACDFSVESAVDMREAVFNAAVRANIVLLGLSSVKLTLEDIFSELAGGEETDNESRIS